MTFSTDVRIRYRDRDPLQHVNNAVYVTYLEEARAAFHESVVGRPLTDVDTVLVHLEVDYERPIVDDRTVTVDLTVGDLGRSSVPMEYDLYSADRGTRFATASSVQVYVDRSTGEATALPDWYRDRLATARDTQSSE